MLVPLYNAYGDTQGSNRGENLRQVSKEIGSEQIPKSTIAALGKMPGSEGNYGQTAKHRQYCVNVARLKSTQLWRCKADKLGILYLMAQKYAAPVLKV